MTTRLSQRWAAILVSLLATACVGDQKHPLPLAEGVDIGKMYGGWYIVATIPNRFEKGMVAPYDVFSARPDADIQEDFYVQKGSFTAPKKHFSVHDWVRPGTHNAHWRVQIFWPINLPFLLLHVDADYQNALFGENSRDLGWVYSRHADMDDATYQRLLGIFASRGYDTSRFLRVVHHPEQIGLPGFWSDGITASP